VKSFVAAAGIILALTGIATAAVSVGAFIPGAEPYAADIEAFNSGTGKTHAIILFYRGLKDTDPDNTYLLEQCRAAGAVPYVNALCQWEYGSIISGSHDADLRTMARAFRDFGSRILMCLDSEMNLVKDVAPSSFVQMWRRVHAIFGEEGASNIEWVWSPNCAPANYAAFYPGDAYVHWVGTEGFSWKDNISAASIFAPILSDFAARYPHKPAIISYTAGDESTPSLKASWISAAYSAFTVFPNLKAVVWWNDSVDTYDFRVYHTSYKPSPVPVQVTTAYRNAVSPATYLSALPPYSELADGDGGSPGVGFTLNPSPVSRGSTLTLNWTITDVTQPIDAYLAAMAPDGTLFVADANLAWSTGIRPIARGYNPGGTGAGSLQFTVPGAVAAGVYTLEAVIVPAGESVLDSALWMGGMFSSPITVR
jgi:hypothetical protein